MTITITAPGEYITTSGEEPTTGSSYALEDLSTGTGAQNRAFHALIGEYWKSGAHSYDAETFDDFRNQIKRSLGAGFESYAYAIIRDGKARIMVVNTWEDIPNGLRIDPEKRELIRGRLKSWSDYTKTERRETLDRLIAEMLQAGVNTRHFHEIMEGLDKT